MWTSIGRRICFYIGMGVGLMALHACSSPKAESDKTEMQAFEAFSRANGDSVAIDPRKVRAKAFRLAHQTKDSLVKYAYLSITLKTYLITSQIDSVEGMIDRIEAFTRQQPPSSVVADLQSECLNMRGNLYARAGNQDSAVICFRQAYERRVQGTKTEVMPDILMNLADASSRQGRLDVGAAWFRKALQVCDSLNITSAKKPPIYYGLAQIYATMRDFEQCDRYYDLAGQSYDCMLPYEKYIYLNNRGTSYYFREDYPTSMGYFRKVIGLVQGYPDMNFELNLSWLNLGDCFLQLQKADSASKYINQCLPFFQKMGVKQALYYIDTQNIELALLRKDMPAARRILNASITPQGLDPEMVHIRNKYLQQFHEETGNYKQAYYYLKENNRQNDSIRNERVAMRTADLALRYQQDSTLLAQKVLIQTKENELLGLRQTKAFWIVLLIIALLVAGFVYVYSKKKRALLLAQNRRTVSTLRLENIRNRLSPHFIFNVLNQEMVGRKEEERQELTSLVRLMRRNLELAEQLCVTLTEELDFVKTYIDLERRSLSPSFQALIEIDADVHPDEVMLPSMLIQIPVENAIKHALRGKEGERCLWIKILRQPNGICIRITDNGGGYRQDSRNRGTGTGMKVIMQTIQILNMKNKEAIDVSIHNVTLEGDEIGCEVIFQLPQKYDYQI